MRTMSMIKRRTTWFQTRFKTAAECRLEGFIASRAIEIENGEREPSRFSALQSEVAIRLYKLIRTVRLIFTGRRIAKLEKIYDEGVAAGKAFKASEYPPKAEICSDEEWED